MITEALTTALQSLRGLDGPRALLVTLDDDGQVQHCPVAQGASVLNVQTDLIDHLNEVPVTDEYLEALQRYCQSRLEARRQVRGDSGAFVIAQPGKVWTIMHMTDLQSMEALQDVQIAQGQ